MPWLSRMIADDEMPMPNSAVIDRQQHAEQRAEARGRAPRAAAAMPTPSAESGRRLLGLRAACCRRPRPAARRRPPPCAVSISNVRLRVGQVVAELGVRHRGVRGAAVLADLRGARRVVRADDRADVLLLGDLREHRRRSAAVPRRRAPSRSRRARPRCRPRRTAAGTALSIRSRTLVDSVPLSENALEYSVAERVARRSRRPAAPPATAGSPTTCAGSTTAPHAATATTPFLRRREPADAH